MSTEIYYFSGTGNSLVIARSIAGKLNGKLISISSVISNDRITTDADVIGIVFPVYYATNDCGIPRIIRRFVGKLENIASKYLFAVCTSGYMPGETIENLAGMIMARGGTLSAGFNVNMTSKSLSHELQKKISKPVVELSEGEVENPNISLRAGKKQPKKQNDREKKLAVIVETVITRKKGKLETRGLIGKIIYAPLQMLAKPVFLRIYQKLAGASLKDFQELIPLADHSFKANEKCNGCRICVKVCPVNNIKIVDQKPVWLHHCETCLACYQWCPNEAIHGEIVSYNERYHHPGVNLSDMLRRNSPL